MRSGQASVEAAIAALLLSALLAAAGTAALAAWRAQELAVARVAGDSALRRGRDPVAAAVAAVPRPLAARAADEAEAAR